jgi:hypothetical protein
MWNWLNCYLSGRHEFGVWCQPGEIYLRCVHCGKRSPGWHLGHAAEARAHQQTTRPARLPAAALMPFSRTNAQG